MGAHKPGFMIAERYDGKDKMWISSAAVVFTIPASPTEHAEHVEPGSGFL